MLTVALTGGPGGGKTSLLRRVLEDPELGPQRAVLEKSIDLMRCAGMNPRTAEFQCALVDLQARREDELRRALEGTGKRVILTHRGPLDPCAFW